MRRTHPPRASAKGGSAATSAARRWEVCSSLRGTWTAICAPGASCGSQRARSASLSGTHWSAAFETSRSIPDTSVTAAMSACRNDTPGTARRLREHRRRAVNPLDDDAREPVGQGRGELAGAAAEVQHAHPGARPHARHEVEEGLGALRAEAVVLRRVPGVVRHTPLVARAVCASRRTS